MQRNSGEVVAAIYSQWNNGEWGVEHLHPEVEWEMSSAAFDQTGRSRGRDALMRYWRRFWAAWQAGARWEIEELESITEEQVLATGRLRVAGRSSGLETDVAVFHLWTVKEGLVVRLLVCDDRATALDAAAE
ncbi:MAG: nuclear transport factor 2 family protein [Actinomycetota bacterium]